MPFAAALSEHPVAAEAVGEVLGTIAEKGGLEPDLVVVFVSHSHAEFVGEITAAVRKVLRPRALIGSTTGAVVGGDREVEDVPALALWAAWTGPMHTFRLTTETVETATAVVGIPGDVPEGASLVLLADPHTFPAAALVHELSSLRPDVTVLGGMASGSGATALVLDDMVHRDGAVGVVVPRELLVGPVVSQGCRPVGEVMTVTGSDRQFLLELAGRPALERLTDLKDSLTAEDGALATRGVQLGVAIDETRDEYGRGDFLVRSILGADRSRGVLALPEHVPVGTTTQFQVRDAHAAHDDIHSLLRGVRGHGALLFTCNGRGRSLFGVDDHDAAAVVDEVGTTAVAGMSCAGEFGPVGGRSFVHAFSATVVVFADPDRAVDPFG